MFGGFLFQDSSGHGDSQKETAQPANGGAWAKGLRKGRGVTAFVTPRRTCIGARTASGPGRPSRPFDASMKRTAGATDQASSMLKGTGLRMVLATGE